MPRKSRPSHSASEFDLDVLSSDTDMFRWFLLCYLFGKPIRSNTAVDTWQLFIKEQLDSPWAILQASERELVRTLKRGGYTRYQHVTARGLHTCMEKLIRLYEGSLFVMLESSENEREMSKQLQGLYGVGQKVAEIFMRETEEIFARRAE